MNGKQQSWLIRAASFLLAALMAFGNLYLPGGIVEARAEASGTELFATDFENYTTDASPAATDADWTVKFGTEGVGEAVIKTVNGNKLLAISTTKRPDNSTNTDAVVFHKLDKNSTKYDSVTLSYHVAVANKGTLFFPTVGASLSTGSERVKFGTNGTANLQWTADNKNWPALTVDTDKKIPEEMLRWYTVKLVYTVGETEATCQVYIDGKLTDVGTLGGNNPIGCVIMTASKFGSGEMYVDNIKVTTGDHTPAAVPAAPVGNKVIYQTGFEEADSEKFQVGDFGLDPAAGGYSTKYSNWSLNDRFDSTKGSVQIKSINGNQVLSLTNNCDTAGSNNCTIKLRRNNFGNYGELWVSYHAAFATAKSAAFLPSLCGSDGWTAYFGNNGGNMKWRNPDSVNSDKWDRMYYTDESVVPMEPMRWYTVELHYTTGESVGTVEVYIDGKLTDVGLNAASNQQVNRLMLELNKWGTGDCEMFIDNIQVTTQRHTVAQTPTPLVEEPEEDETVSLQTGFEESEGFQVGKFVEGTGYKGWKAIYSNDEKGSVEIRKINGNQLLAITSETREGTDNTDVVAYYHLPTGMDKAVLSYYVAQATDTGTFFFPSIGYNGASATKFGINSGFKWCRASNGEEWFLLKDGAGNSIPHQVMKWHAVKVFFERTVEGETVTVKTQVYVDGVLTNADTYKTTLTDPVNRIVMTASKFGGGTMYVDNLTLTAEDHEIGAVPADLYVKAESVKFTQDTMTIGANTPTKQELVFTPADATEQGVVLTSSDPSIAYIREDGYVVGMSAGTVTITADPVAEGLENATMQLTVTVTDVIVVTIQSEDISLPVGGHTVIISTVTPEDANFSDVIYSSSDPSVATVDEYGEILALKAGTVTVTAVAPMDHAISDSITVTVTEPTVMDTIYVAPDGTDDAMGTEANPVSLQGALTLIAAKNDNMTGNIEVILAGGYYFLTETLKITEAHSGTNHYTVVWKAAEGETPILGSAWTVTGTWVKDETTGIWSVDVPADTDSRQLYVNNVRAVRARSQGGLTGAKFLTNAESANIGYISKDVELAKLAIPEDLELVFKEEWTQPRIGVASITDNGDGTVNIVLDQPGWKYLLSKGQTQPKYSGPVWLENALELLDEPGEWYLDTKNDKLYYMPRPWEDMTGVKVTLPALDNFSEGELVTVIGADYDNRVENIRFEGITFADTTWLRPNTTDGHADAQNNHIRQNGDQLQTAAVVVRKANAVWFTGCTFTRLGITGLQMVDGVQNSFIIGNHFFDISGSAINIGDPNTSESNAHAQGNAMMKNNDIHNNYIHDIGVEYGSAAAISVGFAADMDMTHNEIFDIPYSGWHIGYGWNNRFPNNTKNMLLEYNFVHDYMDEDIYDGGGIYVLGNTSGEGYNIARYNYFRNQMDAHGAMYSDQGTSYFRFIENVVDLTETPAWRNGSVAPKWMHCNKTAEEVYYLNNYSTTTVSAVTRLEHDVTVSGLVVDPTAQWEGTNAPAIIAAAGLESDYACLRNGQAERIVINAADGEVELPRNGSFRLDVTFTDGKDNAVSGGDLLVAYASADPSVAAVSEDGVISAVGQGVTEILIYVVSNNVLDTKKVTVAVADEMTEVKLVGITDCISMSIQSPGKALTAVIGTALNRELEADSVTYAIGDRSVATVDENGVVKPVAVGQTTLTVTAELNGQSVTGIFKVVITETVQVREDNAWEIFDQEKEDTWFVKNAENWVLVDDTSITTKLSAYATFTGAQYADELLSFNLKVDASLSGGGWTPALVLRAQGTETYVSAGIDGYILCMGKAGLELYRFNNGVRYVIYGNYDEDHKDVVAGKVDISCKQGDKITDSAWTFDANNVAQHDIRIGAVSDGSDVRIVLTVDGQEVINYLDKAENGAMSDPGYFGMIGRGEVWTLTKNTQITDEEPMAAVGDTVYLTFAEALAAAEEGEVVSLLADTAVDSLILNNSITLDLNGYDLEASYVVAFNGSELIDSAQGVGLLKCKLVRLNADNGAMPVWDHTAGGYRLFTVKSQQDFKAQNADSFEYVARPLLNAAANNPFLAQSETNGLRVKVKMSWQTVSGNVVEQRFAMKEEDVRLVYTTPGKVIQLTVSGAAAYAGKLYVTACIESETGVVWTGADLCYTGE